MSPKLELAVAAAALAFTAAWNGDTQQEETVVTTGKSKAKPSAPKEPVVTADEIKELVTKAVQDLGLGAGVKKLVKEKFGVDKASAIEPKDFPAFKVALEKMIEDADF